MQLRDFAERVLYGRSLEDKLAPPGRLRDDAPGPALSAAPSWPGRPPELALDRGRIRVRFPGARALDRPGRRGEVLHFFANHELLALELMALVLLRFPEAPAAFRRGLVSTLVDEQRHLGLYLERMEQCGVALGAIPVSTFFWDCLAGAPDPLRFVSGMSLTFEQANLDYALYYERAFRAAGDGETAAVLRRVYEDELRHVRHGLRWFRRWKDPALSDFQAHAALLAPPLSPARARGTEPSVAARRAAGLGEDYIQSLSLCARSKGRPPVLRWFNPDVEIQVAAGRPQTPPAAVRDLAADLALLPAWLGAGDDVLLVPALPSPGFAAALAGAGLALPELVAEPSVLAGRALGGLEPWGWGPGAAAQLGAAARAAEPDHARWAAAFGKDWGASLGAALAAAWGEDWLGGSASICRSPGEVEAALSGDDWIKAPFSAAGRGRVRRRGRWEPAARAWVERTLERWGRVVVEPHLERVAELSVLLRVGADGVRREGFGRSLVDGRGQYRGSLIGPPLLGMPREVLRFLTGDGRDPRRLDRIGERVAAHVGGALSALGFRGRAGVDTMIWRGAAGLRLRPVLEVNPRSTMGHVAARLARRLAPGTSGVLAVLSTPAARRAGWSRVGDFARALAEPPSLRAGRLVEGVIPLTEPDRARRFAAILAAGPDRGALLERLAARGLRLPPAAAPLAGLEPRG